MSFRVELDDDGVRTGLWLEPSLEEPAVCGEDAPSLESLFFFEDLFGSLPRERTFWLNRLILRSDNVLSLAESRPQ